jgi:hypothetical protein
MSDDKPTHTADELRKSANKFVEAFGSDARTASMLRAGADAMDERDKYKKLWADCTNEVSGLRGQSLLDGINLTKAEARVAVLEAERETLSACCSGECFEYAAGKEARVALEKALEKKLAGLGWKLSDEAKKDIAEIERLAHWGPRP